MKKLSLLCIIATMLCSSAFAQNMQWPIRYNGTGNGMDEIKAMATDNSGNVYVTGYTHSGANGYDYITIKYSGNGLVQWTARYDGPGNGNDMPSAIFVTSGGNVIVTGTSDKLAGAYINDDIATVKYNAQGTQLWVARYDGAPQRADAGAAVKVDGVGDVYITGFTTLRTGAYTKKDFITIKYSSGGQQMWQAVYNGPAGQDDAAVGLALDAGNNVYVAGTSFAGRNPLGEQDYVTIKYNTNGVQQWLSRYNGPAGEEDIATGIAVDANGNAYVTGYSEGNNLDYATVKYSTNGAQQWVARYDGAAHGSDLAYAIALDAAGNVYVTGGEEAMDYDMDMRTLKYNSQGQSMWSAQYSSPSLDNDEAHALTVDAQGNVYVTGYVNGLSPNWDMATLKYTADGAQQWIQTYDGNGHDNDCGHAIAVDLYGNVYVAGGSTGANGTLDMVTQRYSLRGYTVRGTLTLKEQPDVKETAVKVNVYPNPVTNLLTIDLPFLDEGSYHIGLSNMAGQQLQEMQVQQNTQSAEMDVSTLPEGMYLLTVTGGGQQEVIKVVHGPQSTVDSR